MENVGKKNPNDKMFLIFFFLIYTEKKKKKKTLQGYSQI